MRLQRSLQFSAIGQAPHYDLEGNDFRIEEKLRYAVWIWAGNRRLMGGLV